MNVMGWLKEFASRIRRGPRLGGDAIRDHVAAVTGSTDAFIFAFDELEVHCYYVDTPLPHFLYSTFGLSRVRSGIPVAGTQTELVLRTPATTPVPYAWPAEQLASMVRMIRRADEEIAPGHYLRLARPVDGEAQIAGFTFVIDPLLGVIEPATGIVRFTYAVGLTREELEAALCWDPLKFTGVLGDYVALGITDPDRADILQTPEARERFEAGMASEGSSISAVHAKLLDTDEHGRIHLDLDAAHAVLRAARHRLPFGRSFALVGERTWLRISPMSSFEADASHVDIEATSQFIHELLAIFDTTPGIYRFHSAPVEMHVVDPST